MSGKRLFKSGQLWTATSLAVLLFTGGAAWGDHVSDRGRTVAANVAFGDRDVSGMSRAQVHRLVEDRASEVLATDVVIDVGDRKLTFSAAEVGFSYDVAGVVDDIMDARHTGGLDSRVIDWLTAPGHTIVRDDRVGYDPAVTESLLGGDPALVQMAPTEPVVTMQGESRFYVEEGEPGEIVDLEDLIARLAAESPVSGTIELGTTTADLPPAISDGEAQSVADSLNDATRGGVELLIGSAAVTLDAGLLRRYTEPTTDDGAITASFDADRLHHLLEGLIREPVTELTPPVMTIVDGEPEVIMPGDPPEVCCSLASIRRAAEVIMAGETGRPITVHPRPTHDPKLEAWASGDSVVELVGEFTTMHACCQGRVTNIHRFADIVRGLYLLPGESVSLNEYVGRRTREKGFVADGAIRRGRLRNEVGGGVSQFATTIFNAAFFAGLDIPVYQAHSIYISRYPFGREATISHPGPDLVLHNTTAHPVLVWTSYTDTSITVSMYSTKHIEVSQIDQRVGRRGRCTYVETDRLRVYPDGQRIVDTFEALYRPANGIDCNGNVIPRG